MAPDLRWAPWGFRAPSRPVNTGILGLGLIAIRISGCLGYLICLRPGTHPVRRIVSLVCLPGTTGLVLMCSFYMYGSTVGSTAFSSGLLSAQPNQSSLSVLSNLGPGFYYALAGLLLIIGFTTLVGLRIASLPLSLPQSSISTPNGLRFWQRVEIFLWVLIALIPLIWWLFPIANFVYYFVETHIHPARNIEATTAELIFSDLVIIAVAISMIGKEAWHGFCRSLSWPQSYSFALAVAFPIGIASVVPSARFLFDLFHSLLYSNPLSLPVGSYFKVPSSDLLFLLPVAFCEEIIFRGILQPMFVRRYGIARGIFLVGVAFAAVHVSGDFSIGFTNGLVILGIFRRLGTSLALSFVTGWLMIRTDSVLPCGILHGLNNVLGSAPLGPSFFGIGPLIDILWAVLACVLFHFWPVQSKPAMANI